jgi:phage I-like protein
MYSRPLTTSRPVDEIDLSAKSVGGIFFQINSVHGGKSAPQWLKLVPAMLFKDRDSRAFLNDLPHDIVAAFAVDQMALPIDMEHSTELNARRGEPAPACGWIEELQVRDGEVWGRVEWNRLGAGLVRSREYQHYSPVFIYDRPSSRIIKLTSVGLANPSNVTSTALNQHAASPNIYSPYPGQRTQALSDNMPEKEDAGAINAAESKVCSLLGISIEDFVRARAAASP